jgi:Acetoacetate decarboxylase (ADC)
MGDDFFEVPMTSVRTTEGPVDLPIFYYDVSVRQLNFFVDYGAALSKLEGTGLVPCKVINGKAVACLAFFNYRDTSIGPYEEVAVIILAYPGTFKDPKFYLANMFKRDGHKWTVGAYVLELPVTIPAARVAGREIWGYPKYLTDIPFTLSDRRFEYAVLDGPGGQPVMTVECVPGPGINMTGTDLVTLTNHEDTILRTIVDVDAKFRMGMCKELRIDAGTTDHRFAQNVRDLGLDRLKPFSMQATESFRSRLNKGWPIAEQATPPPPYPVKVKVPAKKAKKAKKAPAAK